MLVRHSDPVSVLVQWVKEFKANNSGRAPSKADIPAELGPLWSQWIQGMRSVPLKADQGGSGEAPGIRRHYAAPHNAASPTPAASDPTKSHISGTPTKYKAHHDDFECTSRPGGGPLHVSSHTSRSTGVLLKQLVSCSTVGALGGRDPTPKRTPSKKVVKRFKKHEMDAENQQTPQRVQKAFGQDASLLSPLKSPIRNPLQSAPSQNGLLSPSNIRPGLVKRRMHFAGSMTGGNSVTLQPSALGAVPQAPQASKTPALQPMHASSTALVSRAPQQQQLPSQRSANLRKAQFAAAGTEAMPVNRDLEDIADSPMGAPLDGINSRSIPEHAQPTAHADLMPTRQNLSEAETSAPEPSKQALTHLDRPGQEHTHHQHTRQGILHSADKAAHGQPNKAPSSHPQAPAAKDVDSEKAADMRPAAISSPAKQDETGLKSIESAPGRRCAGSRLTPRSRHAVTNSMDAECREKDKAAPKVTEPEPRNTAAASRLTRLSRHAGTDDAAIQCSEDERAEEDAGGSSNTSSGYSFQSGSSKEGDANSGSPACTQGKATKKQTVAQLNARLKQLGLSTAGNKKDLEACLEQHMDSATANQPEASVPQPADTEKGKVRAKSRVAAGTGVFKAQKRKNFVRINLKSGGTQGRFRSKHGGKPTKRRFGRFGRYKPKALPQAGQGQDYVEGCNNKSYICYKCHQPGHWARDCPGEPTDGQDAKPAEEAADGLAADTLPRAVPAPGALPEEAVSEEALTAALQATFDFSCFRRLQLPVIQSVLRGHSTFAIMPTGAGKSLCYQIPALLSGGLVLVVSPLIALMRDQLAHLPAGLPGAMLWSGQQGSEALKTLAAIKEGRVRVLYVSPERVGSSSLRNALAPLLPLPLVCIDEAHCISEWGHNFRSAYFRLGGLLREHVPSRSILALTATATRTTESSVAQALGVAPECVFRDASLRDNLRLHVSHVNGGSEAGSTKKALLKLLRPGGALASAGSVIAYATFQMQAEQVAQFLTSHGIKAAAYHAGKHMKERETVQGLFSRGQLRVVVATVAFGMGIDASFVRAVVHMSMPQSLEEYVQQVGRAGRDGQEAQCHLFLDDADFRRLHSLSNSDSVAISSVHAFLDEAFQAAEDSGASAQDDTEGESLGVAMLASQELSRSMDLKTEVMETLLSYLEAHEEGYVRVLPPVGRTVKVAFYSGSCDSLAHSHPVLRSLLRVCSKPRAGTYSVQLARWANAAGRLPYVILQELASLAKQDMLRFELDTKPTLAFQVMKEPEDLEGLAKELTVRHTKVGRQRMQRLDTVYRTMAQAAKASCQQQQEDSVRAAVEAYFQRPEDAPEVPSNGIGLPLSEKTGFLAKDVRMMLRDTSEKMSAQAVARIMHGISSSAYPASNWKKCGYWGRYSDVDFACVLLTAEEAMK